MRVIFYLPQFRNTFIHSTYDVSCSFQVFQCKIERLAVMRREEQVTDFAPVEAVLFSKIAQGVKVTERLAHFFSLNQKMRAVQPVFDEGPAGRAFALGNLVLVMGKNQIL